jgi:hypothetical protein
VYILGMNLIMLRAEPMLTHERAWQSSQDNASGRRQFLTCTMPLLVF